LVRLRCMSKIVVVVHKKPLGNKQRSLDLALGYLKDNLQLNSNRWIPINGAAIRIGRTSYQQIVIKGFEEINHAISRYIPDFVAFEIVITRWRNSKFHRAIKRNATVSIKEDETHFYIEASIP
jgi:hypothetical protein